METGVEPEDLSQNPEYAGRLEYHGDKKNGHNLRIADLREKDSATYKFRFITDQTGGKYTGDPGVTLSVTDVVLEMDPTSVSERENVTLTCRTKCTLDPITVYSWYKNGQPVPNSNTYSPVYILFSVSSEDTGRYSCAVEGHEDLPSAEETLTVTSVFPWVPVVGVGAVLTAGALLLTIYCTLKRRSKGGSDATADTQSVHPDPNSETYTALNIKTWSPVYDTLENVRGLPSDTAPQIDAEPSIYENLRLPPQNLD
ncbi:sialoadhesin-like [Salmo trutta]|uniref:sialoadhesin-like n=1 Tax=Salmo trutta TaxID=8032 RepID=UPI00112FFF70|nr:sialoadhesin-like [Salmo trutta]